MDPSCVCAGDSWPEGAAALEDVGMGGGFEDMAMLPTSGGSLAVMTIAAAPRVTAAGLRERKKTAMTTRKQAKGWRVN